MSYAYPRALISALLAGTMAVQPVLADSFFYRTVPGGGAATGAAGGSTGGPPAGGVNNGPTLAVSGMSSSYSTRQGKAFATGAPTMTGAVGAVTWSAVNLPAWLGVNADGSISAPTGVPADAVSASGIVLVGRDATMGASAPSAPFSVSVLAAPSVAQSAENVVQRVRGSVSVSAVPSGVLGTPSYAMSVLSGSVPAGLTFDSVTGELSGQPQAAGDLLYKLVLTDGSDNTSVTSPTSTHVKVWPEFTLAVPGATSYLARQGLPFTAGTPVASGVVGSITYATSLPSLPGMNPFPTTTGILSGTPTNVLAQTSVQLTATDTYDYTTASFTYGLRVAALPSVTALPDTILHAGRSSTPFVTVPVTANVFGVPAFALASGSLPSGVTVGTDGRLVGTPSIASASPFEFSLKVTDATDNVTGPASPTFRVSVAPALLASVAPATAKVHVDVDSVVSPVVVTGALSGTPVYAVEVSSGALPVGAKVDANGLAFKAASAGAFTYRVRVTDSDSTSTLADPVAVTVLPALTASVVSGSVTAHVATQKTVAAATAGNAIGAVIYSILPGTGAPADISVVPSSGVVSFTPSVAGSFTYRVKVTDAFDGTTGTSGPVAVAVAPALTASVGSTSATARTSQTKTVAAPTVQNANGTVKYAYETVSGSSPANAKVDAATGVVTFTPASAGSFAYRVRVTDDDMSTTTETVTVNALPALTASVSGATVASGHVGYDRTVSPLTVTNGVGPYTYAAEIVSGTLPAGATASSAGLKFKATVVGSFTYRVRVTDTSDNTSNVSENVVVTVLNALTASVPTTTVSARVGTLKTQAAVASTNYVGAAASLQYALTAISGTLPSDTMVDASGIVSFTPAATGTFAYQVKVTDVDGMTANTATVTTTVNGVLAVAAATTAKATTTYETTVAPLTVSGNLGTVTYSVQAVSGTLPSGYSITAAGLKFTSSVAGTFSYKVTVTDTDGATAQTPDPTVVTVSSTLPLASVTKPDSYTTSGNISISSGSVEALYDASDSTKITASSGGTAVVLTFNTPVTADCYVIKADSGYSSFYGVNYGLYVGLRSASANTSATTTTTGAYQTVPVTSQAVGTVQLSPVPGNAPAVYEFRLGNMANGVCVNPGAKPVITASVGSTTASTKTGVANTLSGVTVTNSSGAVTYTVQGVSGTLPSNLAVSASAITFTPTVAGTFSFYVTATDSIGATANTATVTVTVAQAPTVVLTPSAAQTVAYNTAMSPVTVSTLGFVGTPTWSVSGNPSGVSLSATSGSNVTLSGSPSAGGTFNIVVSGKGSDNVAYTNTLVMTVTGAPAVTITTPLRPWVASGGGIQDNCDSYVTGSLCGASNSYAEYDVSVTVAGNYKFGARGAADSARPVPVSVDGSSKGTVFNSATGGWYNANVATLNDGPTVYMTAGTHRIRLGANPYFPHINTMYMIPQ